jgi:MoaA/NifB/PqqE/SkfB family radical SAM enzyme
LIWKHYGGCFFEGLYYFNFDSYDGNVKINCDSKDIFECNKCQSQEVCNRGCRLRAFNFHGTFLAPDPFCCKIFNNDFPDTPIGDLFWGEKH